MAKKHVVNYDELNGYIASTTIAASSADKKGLMVLTIVGETPTVFYRLRNWNTDSFEDFNSYSKAIEAYNNL